MPIYLSTIGGAFFFSFIIIKMMKDLGAHFIPLAWLGVLFTLPLMFLAGASLAFFAMRPVGIGDEGVATFMFGRRWRLLPWSDVKSVERIRVYDTSTLRMRSDFLVRTCGSTIRFDEYLENADRLIDKLNFYIEKYQIPAFEVDRGRETRRAPIAGVVDILQGNSQDGVRTPTTRF